MLAEIALIQVLNGKFLELKTFPTTETTKTLSIALSECKQSERMLKPCMLKQQRNAKTFVFTNLDSWYQIVAYKTLRD